ncbi:MAG: hypothetical protein QXU63_05625 [Nitrososphaerota archaeon]
MEKGRKEARIGLDSEEDIINRINNDSEFRNTLRKYIIYLGFTPEGEIIARKDRIKTDILIKINGEIGISVKSSTKTSFHNLDRRRLENWKELLDMPDEIFKTIKEAILRVARNSRDKFILEADRVRIKEFFTRHLKTIIDEIFRKGEQTLKLLMINDKQERKIYIYNMDEVLDFLYNNAIGKINFSNKGIIKLGDFITVQRKGGNGKRVTIPKTDWNHPGNQLQFKFSPLQFAKYVAEKRPIKFYVINY